MAETGFDRADALVPQRWEEALTYEAEVGAYWNKFEGTSRESLVVVKDELSKNAGEKVTFGMRAKLSGDGKEGDDTIEGTAAEEAVDFFDESLEIDQRRKGTLSKGKMSDQRVTYNLQSECHDALKIWFIEDRDQIYFCYASGARGINADFHTATSWTGRANNTLRAPNAANIIYGGNATAKGDLDSSDVMSLTLVERLVAKAETQDPMIQPFLINGEKKYVLLMHTWQKYQLRTSTTENDWLKLVSATQRGEGARIYKNSLGEYADVVMHSHRSVIRFEDYGSGADLNAARALFLGAQALCCAYGRNVDNQNDAKGMRDYSDLENRRFWWNQETADRGNKLAVTGGIITGVQKTRFNSKDFGTIAVDTYCADPNA
jgi:N4-gp56 family major capsid protein